MVVSAATRLARVARLASECAQKVGPEVDAVGRLLVGSLAAGGKVLAAGNGGSMAQAMHFAEECLGRFRGDRPAIAALAVSDPAFLTCAANDFGYTSVFARAVEGLARRGDALLLLSTSGRSQNLMPAVEAARRAGAGVAALLGGDGGPVALAANACAVFPGDTADEVQDLHMVAIHALLAQIEAGLVEVA